MADDPKFLQKVPDDKRFGLSNGRSIGSLEELYTSVRDSDESVFYHHVTADRNDFANWIKYVIGSEDIFNKVSTIKQKEIFLGVLSDEMTALNNVVRQQISQASLPKQSALQPSSAAPQQAAAQQQVVIQLVSVQPNSSQPLQSVIQSSIPLATASPASVSSSSVAPSTITPMPISPSSNSLSSVAPIVTPPTTNPPVPSQASVGPQPGSAIIVPSEEMMEFESVLKSVIDEIEAEMFTWEG